MFQAPDGQRVTTGENKAIVGSTLSALDGGDQVAATTDPYKTGAVSEDGTIAYSTITYTVDGVDLAESTKSALEDAAEKARDAGLTVEIGGSALDSEEAPGGTTEIIGVVVAAVVLILALGSLVAAGLSLLTAFWGVAIAFGVVSALAAPLGLTSTVAILVLMLGLAVGIDYALFITSRFRDELAQGTEAEEAAAGRWARPGPPWCSPARPSSSPWSGWGSSGSPNSPRWAWAVRGPWLSPSSSR